MQSQLQQTQAASLAQFVDMLQRMASQEGGPPGI